MYAKGDARGPELDELKKIVRWAKQNTCLDTYFGSGKPLHFVSLDKSERPLKFAVSKIVDRLASEKSKVNFMV